MSRLLDCDVAQPLTRNAHPAHPGANPPGTGASGTGRRSGLEHAMIADLTESTQIHPRESIRARKLAVTARLEKCPADAAPSWPRAKPLDRQRCPAAGPTTICFFISTPAIRSALAMNACCRCVDTRHERHPAGTFRQPDKDIATFRGTAMAGQSGKRRCWDPGL